MEWIADPNAWMALATLTILEIVLGIDNIIFIAIVSAKVKPQQQKLARQVGLFMAMLTRIALLFSLTLIMKLTKPWFAVFGAEISGRDIILLIGGLFLLVKATVEIHDKLEGEEEEHETKGHASFFNVIVQIMILDIVFSLDSVITAIGLAEQLAIMVIAIVIAVIFMLVFVGAISRFVEAHPTIKILALSFLLLIGLSLLGEGLDMHIPKGYLYFAMAFSVFVEILNMKLRSAKKPPVKLRQKQKAESAELELS